MYHVVVDKIGNIQCVTKNDKDKTDKVLAVDFIKKQLSRLPYGSHLMVELHCPGELATTIAHMIAHSDQRLRISVFAAPLLGDVDKCLEPLDLIMDQIARLGLGVVPVKMG